MDSSERVISDPYRTTKEEAERIRELIREVDRHLPDTAQALTSLSATLLERGFSARAIVAALDECAIIARESGG